MAERKMIAFRVPGQLIDKLKLMAVGQGTTATGVLVQLLDDAPVEEVSVIQKGLALRKKGGQPRGNKNTSAVIDRPHAGVCE